MRVGTGRILDYQTGDGTAIGLSLVYLLLDISRINLLGVMDQGHLWLYGALELVYTGVYTPTKIKGQKRGKADFPKFFKSILDTGCRRINDSPLPA
jgi:hypothetical protein